MARKKRPFSLKPRVTTIVFADGSDLDGLEVDVNLRVPMGFIFDLATIDPDDVPGARRMMEGWAARCLISWNLTDVDGAPVPATAEGFLREVDPESGALLILKYVGLFGRVAGPLGEPSSSART
jgi:hypothetical protein